MTIDSLLVPLDGSPFAEQALPLGAAIARKAGAKLRLALVHQPAPPPAGEEATRLYASVELAVQQGDRNYLDKLARRLEPSGAFIHSVVLSGEGPGPALVRYADESDAALVVMTTHGRGGLERARLGSVADHLVRHLHCPVLLVRPQEGGGSAPTLEAGGRILVLLDGSPLAETALPPAAELARLFGVELELVQVVEAPPLAADARVPVPMGADEELAALRRREARDYLGDLAERCRREGARVTAAVAAGRSAPETILDLARGESVALVALATHGRGGLRRAVLGSVADEVIRGADRPVLVYRPRESEIEGAS